MCLALAEILLKQTGDSSLDRARQQHRHHGLLFRELQAAAGANLNASAGALKAAPYVNATNERVGTFELWHRSSREMPAVGIVNELGGKRRYEQLRSCSGCFRSAAETLTRGRH